MIMRWVLVLILGLSVRTAAGVEPVVEVRLPVLDFIPGQVVRIESDQIQIQKSAETVTYKNTEFLEIGAIRQQVGKPWIVLPAGEILVVDRVQSQPESIHAESLTWKPFQCPTDQVRAILLQPPRELIARDKLLELAKQDRASDQLLLPNGTQLTGDLVFFAESRLQLVVRGLAEPLEFLLSDLSAVFFAGKMSPIKTVHQIGFTNGSYGGARKISRIREHLVWQTASGPLLETEVPLLAAASSDYDPWSLVCYYRPHPRTSIYLHDLVPSRYRYLPVLPDVGSKPTVRRYELSRNATGGMLRHGKKSFLAGIGMVSVSQLSFKIPDGCTHFQSEIGVDCMSGRQGSVTFHVLLQYDDEGKWASVYDSRTIRGGDDLQPIRIPLGDAKQLSLVVDMADEADVMDYANWINARFIKQP